jgi:GT2 family glycosyltransferase
LAEASLKVSCFLITRNRVDDLCDCIDHLLAQDYRPLEIVLLDNASSDGTLDRVARDYPEVVRLASDRNLGVAGGRNCAMEACTGDLLVGVDDDAILEDTSFLQRMVAEFEADPTLGCLCPRIVNYHTGLMDPKELPAKDKRKSDRRFETSYFVGCLFAIPRTVLDRTGNFPAGYFYAGEESDLGLRIFQKGYRLVYEPSFVVRHKVSPLRSTNRTKYRYYIRNRIWFAVSFYPAPYLLVYLFTSIGVFFVKSLLERAAGEFFIGIREGFSGLSLYRERRRTLLLDQSTIRRLRKVENRLLH